MRPRNPGLRAVSEINGFAVEVFNGARILYQTRIYPSYICRAGSEKVLKPNADGIVKS